MKRLGQGIIIEYVQRGGYLKVSAVDTVTGTEVSIVADPQTDRQTLDNLAIKKLQYVMNKNRNA